MPIRITGMNSGLDTEALVSELVSAYRAKGDKYTKAQTKISWKQEAWKTMSSKTYSFRNKLDSLRFSTGYNLKTTTVSNSSKAIVIAGNNAVNGTQSLEITSLAKTGYLTGGKLKSTDGKSVSGDTTLAKLGYSGSGTISLNGKEISLRDDMTVNEAVTAFKGAGVDASFDATNQRIFVSAKTSGKENDFSMAALNSSGVDALKSLGLYVKSDTNSALYKEYDAKYGGKTTDQLKDLILEYNKNTALIADANETESYMAKALAYAQAKETIAGIEKKLEDVGLSTDKIDQAKDLLANKDTFVGPNGETYLKKSEDGEEYYILADGSDSTKYYLTTKTTTVKETDKDGNEVSKDVTTRYLSTKEAMEAWNAAESDAPAGAIEVQTSADYLKDSTGLSDEDINNYRSAQTTIKSTDEAVAAEKAAKIAAEEKAAEAGETYSDPSKEGNYTDYRSLEAIITKINDENLSSDDIKAEQERIAQEKKTAQDAVDQNSLLANYAKDYATATDDVAKQDAIDRLFSDVTYASSVVKAEESSSSADYSEGAVRIDGQDATILLNGAEFTSNSNSFSINGLTINATALTEKGEVLSITTATDNQGIYDKIKDFLSDYNSLINSMTSAYNAESSSDYEPLTDDEKESMTDSEIEKWEEKGKSGILRRDTTLSMLMSAMTNAMAKSYTINGKTYALSSFGIKTLGILNSEKNEQNAYHIDGDADDENTSGNADKLMAAIVSDPDGVTQFFQKLTSDIYDSLGKNMTSTSLRSYGKFYNDKELEKQYNSYTTKISDWEQKVSDIEDSYYKKFAAMESALATLQSQSSQLSGLLG